MLEKCVWRLKCLFQSVFLQNVPDLIVFLKLCEFICLASSPFSLIVSCISAQNRMCLATKVLLNDGKGGSEIISGGCTGWCFTRHPTA